MSDLKLTYFDTTSGRGEPLRILFKAGNIPFEDHRISFAEFGQTYMNFPMGAVPVLEKDGHTYTQTNSLLRYYGKLTGFYPEDSWEAYKCDEVMDATEDLIHKLVQTFGLKDDALVAARKKLLDGPITRYLKLLDARLEAAGGHYLADNRFTVADMKVFIQLRSFTAGFIEHVPADVTSTVAPKVQAYADRIAKEAAIVEYDAD
ncbi:MAG: glutathione S-transferase family protein [Gammaproteobacteria bacterium]